VVKIGFIVEGDTEKIVIESDTFQKWAKTQGIEICSPVLNAKGSGNLLPQNIEPMIVQLQRAKPNHIVILTDLEYEPNEDAVRNRIGTTHTELIFVAVKAIEAWFLADTHALKKWLKIDVTEYQPENTEQMPWDRLKAIAVELGQRGTGDSKPAFAKRMVKHYEFSMASAAQHPNCPSAKKFHNGLIELGLNKESL
jgi:hypothetical protein